MTKREKNKVRHIAYKVRGWAEEFAANSHDFSPNLSSMCGLCSHRLWKSLRSAGFKAYVATNGSHAFVVLDDYLIDVTASQFINDGTRVCRVNFRKLTGSKVWFWKVDQKSATSAAIRKLFRTWPASQNPYKRFDDFKNSKNSSSLKRTSVSCCVASRS